MGAHLLAILCIYICGLAILYYSIHSSQHRAIQKEQREKNEVEKGEREKKVQACIGCRCVEMPSNCKFMLQSYLMNLYNRICRVNA